MNDLLYVAGLCSVPTALIPLTLQSAYVARRKHVLSRTKASNFERTYRILDGSFGLPEALGLFRKAAL
jgi:hypothetical protein